MMPAPAFWSAARAAWHAWCLYAAAMTAPPPLPHHIRREAILHCEGVGTVQVVTIDTAAGLCTVRQALGNPWLAPYSALTPASAAEIFAFQAEATRRAKPRPVPQARGQVIPFPGPTPTGPSAA